MNLFVSESQQGARMLTSGLPIYILVGFLIYLFFIRKKPVYKQVLYSVFMIYMMLVVETTLMPIPLNQAQILLLKQEHTQGLNLNILPFFYDYYILDSAFMMHFIYLNIFMFIPFGILVNLLLEKQSFAYTLLYSILFSLSIETVQLIMQLTLYTDRVSDINDIIANTLGGVIGYLLFVYAKFRLKVNLEYEVQNPELNLKDHQKVNH